jgi:hypothetical protein
MIVSEVQVSAGPAGMTVASFCRAAGGGAAVATIPAAAAATAPTVLATVPLSVSEPSASSASHILAQFDVRGWNSGAKDSDAEDQIGMDASSHENENPKRTGPSGLAAQQAKAGAIGNRLFPFGWLFSFVLEAARSCWVRIVVPASSWLWVAITTTSTTATAASGAAAAGNSAAAAVPAHQHLKPLPTLHHLTVHESRNPLLPPGLMYLATLTLFALVIHPDGYTWIVLRRIRCVRGSRRLLFRARSLWFARAFTHRLALISPNNAENSWPSPFVRPPRCGPSCSRTTGPSFRRSSPLLRSPRSSSLRTCCGKP